MQRLIFAIVLSALFPALGLAQSAKDSWDNLKQLQAGQKIQVVDMNWKSFKGELIAVTDEGISLQVKKDEISVERQNVLRVSDRERTRRGRNAVIGAMCGGLLGLVVGLVNPSDELGAAPSAVLSAASLGGIGAGVGAAVPGHPTIYRAKSPRESRQ